MKKYIARNGELNLDYFIPVVYLAKEFCQIKGAICKISFDGKKRLSFEQKLKIFSVFFLFVFCAMFALFRAYSPGAFSPDSIWQFSQATSGSYNDWHPVWHTIIFFTIPLKITGSVFSICLFQMFVFSIFCASLALFVCEYSNLIFALGVVFFAAFNPFSREIILYPWKDCGFAIFSGFCMLFAARIYLTGGEWISKNRRILIFAFFLASATIFRHNAILFTFPLLIFLFSFMSREKWILLFLSCAVLFFAVKIPLYSHLNVSKPDRRTTETMGLPTSVICFCAQKCPEKLDLDTIKFVWDLCRNDKNVLARYNVCGYNSIKLDGSSDFEAIERAGKKKMLLMTLGCFLHAPKQSLIAFFGLTRCVWSLEYISRADVDITQNNFGIVWNGSQRIRKIVEDCTALVCRSFLKYTASIGVSILIMIAFILFKTDFKNRTMFKRLLLAIPIFAYDFGTMILLTGPDTRFFWVNFLVCPIVAVIFCATPYTPQKNGAKNEN